MTGSPPPDDKRVAHTLPTTIPASDLARYSPSRDPDMERDIGRYVEIEAPDESVQNVELIKTEVIAGVPHSIWDVTTDKSRWWVIDNLTNLYSQEHFPSLDFTLSFHVGLMMRLRSRPAGAKSEDPSPFDEVLRRQEQSKSAYDHAVEPEDYQAVALQLRECLLSLLPAMRRHIAVEADAMPAQEGNFIAWYEALMNAACPGGSNKELRHFLKSTARETWQLVSWLVHDRDADDSTLLIAIHSCDNVAGHSMQVLERHARGPVDECPVCQSRNIRSHYDPFLGEEGEYYLTCGACRWTNHPGGDEETEDTDA
jgi:hypothetical protein